MIDTQQCAKQSTFYVGVVLILVILHAPMLTSYLS